MPEGFGETLADAGIAGMRVLWFERDNESFRRPCDVVLERRGDDVDPRFTDRRGLVARRRHRHAGKARPVGTRAADAAAERRQRANDRRHLWDAFRDAGVTRQDMPPTDTQAIVDAAIGYVAATPSPLALFRSKTCSARPSSRICRAP